MRKSGGFTLIELLIVVVIVAILAAIGLPNYRNYIYRSKRSDGQTSLMNVQMAQEKYRSNNTTYGTMTQIGFASDPMTSVNGYYTYTTSATSATGFTATATAIGAQASDTTCATITVTMAAGNASYTPAACWGK